MKIKLFFMPILLLILVAACTKEPTTPNDEELITTVDVQFTNGSDVKHLTFRDVDGSGGNAPIITTDALTANVNYNVKINLYNESVTPVDTITYEVEDEGDEHQFFFSLNPTNLAVFAYADQDVNGRPIGLLSTCNTSNSVAAGTLNLVLRHQPDKTAANVSAGDITNAGGETDIEINFDFVVL